MGFPQLVHSLGHDHVISRVSEAFCSLWLAFTRPFSAILFSVTSCLVRKTDGGCDFKRLLLRFVRVMCKEFLGGTWWRVGVACVGS